MSTDLRHRINPKHLIFGHDYRLLQDHEMIVPTDETARVSLLLSLDGEEWGTDPDVVGVTVGHACTAMGDMDGGERVFRRHNEVLCSLCRARVRVVTRDGSCVDCINARVSRQASRAGTEGGYARAYDFHRATLVSGLKARGAHYPEDNFYGLVHETAHGFDLGLPDADPKAINDALQARTEYERLKAEVVAKSTARYVSAFFGAPLFPDGVRYAARSVKQFAERDGKKVIWTPEDFVDETVRMHGSDRVENINTLVLTALLNILGA